MKKHYKYDLQNRKIKQITELNYLVLYFLTKIKNLGNIERYLFLQKKIKLHRKLNNYCLLTRNTKTLRFSGIAKSNLKILISYGHLNNLTKSTW